MGRGSGAEERGGQIRTREGHSGGQEEKDTVETVGRATTFLVNTQREKTPPKSSSDKQNPSSGGRGSIAKPTSNEMDENKDEREKLIPTKSPEIPVAALPVFPNERPIASYSDHPETETLLETSTDYSGDIAAYFNSAASHSNVSTPISADFKSHGCNTNPQINLRFSSTDFIGNLSVYKERNSDRKNNEKSAGQTIRDSENCSNSIASSYSDDRDYSHRHHDINSQFEDPTDNLPNDDTKSQSRLSASPDFWRRVSPQLVYIDSSSYGGRSDSVQSSGSIITSRGRPSERNCEIEGVAKYHRGRSVDSCRDLDRSAPRLYSERSVSWNLADENIIEQDGEDDRNLDNVKCEKLWVAEQAQVHLMKDFSDEKNYSGICDEEMNVVTEYFANKNKTAAREGFIAKLLRKWNNVKGNSLIQYNKSASIEKSDSTDKKSYSENKVEVLEDLRINISPSSCSTRICRNSPVIVSNSQSSSTTTTTTADSGLEDNDHHSRPKQPTSTTTTTTADSGLGSNVSTANDSAKLKEIEANKVREHLSIVVEKCAPRASEERGLDLITTEIAVVTETKSRGKIRRYFSLDSSVPRPLQHGSSQAPQFRRTPFRRPPNLQIGQRRRPLRHDPQHPEQSPNTRGGVHSQHQQYYMEKDLRYYFQHPWFRLVVAYLVIFCNFLLFAEDPLSHSHTGKPY